MRKLLIAPIAELRRYVSREWWATFTLLAEAFGWDCLDIEEVAREYGSLPDVLQRRFGALPHVVLFREGYPELLRHRRSLSDAGARIYVLTEDLHVDFHGMAEALRVADGILSPYAPRLAAFYPDQDPARLFWIPHAAGPDFVLPIAESPRPVIFVSGNVDREHYPFRHAMRELALRRPELAAVQPHPKYRSNFDYEKDKRVGRGYAETIRSCFAAFTDGTRYLYLVAKYFEIPATGALLVADRAAAPQLAMLGFEDGVHYVSAAPDDLEEVVERVLDRRNFTAMDAIRRRGHDLVHENHTVLERARQIDAVCV
ncbi:MAG TPA: glycosyltransferase [Thermoanaerobaculia bacterium]|nr:glycosyltransferase [Thermoanaerobaculia bacterium]